MAFNRRKSEFMLQSLKANLLEDYQQQQQQDILVDPVDLECVYDQDIIWELGELTRPVNKKHDKMAQSKMPSTRTLPPLINVPDAIRHLSLADTKQLKLFQKRHNFLANSVELMDRNEYTKQRKRYTKRMRSLDDSAIPLPNRTDHRARKIKPTLFEQKDAAMLNLSLDSKLWNIKQTLEMMGSAPKPLIAEQPQTTDIKRKRTISKRFSGEDLNVIVESEEGESTGLPSYRGTMTDSDSSLGLNARRRHRRKKAAKLARKWKRLVKFLTLFFSLWRIHAAKVKNFLDTNVDLIEIEEPIDLMFDVTEYKADKQACVSQETKRILQKNPKDRTIDEVKYVQVALRNYQSIEEYPIKMTSRLAEKAWYEKYDGKRIIIQQDHASRCFYFILSGSVVVSKMDEEYGVSRTVCFLNRGESFGELGLINNAPRQATVISKEPVELLVINDEDYVEIFMGGGIKGTGDNFIENLWCFEGWPIEILPDHPTESFLSYFKRNTILAHDSKISDWIYVIKSGSCTVIKKLRQVQPTKKGIKTTISYTHESEEDSDEEDLAEIHQAALMQKAELKSQANLQKRSLQFREKELKELKLGIELASISKDAFPSTAVVVTETNENNDEFEETAEVEKEDNVSEEHEDQENMNIILEEAEAKSQETTDDSKVKESQIEVDSNNKETENTQSKGTDSKEKEETTPKRKLSVVKQLASKRKTSLSGPFLKTTPDVHMNRDNKDRQRKRSSVKQPFESKRRVSVYSSVSDGGPSIIVEEVNGSENKTSQPKEEENDEITRIRREFDEIIRGDTKKHTKSFKPEKKTITDELNKNYLKMKHDAPEDLHPTFVRVQTLTKGAVFGLTDLVHYDQPSLSLVSNGAECIVIRKKFFEDHCSPVLMDKIRQQVSPYPKNEEIQNNLQTYVNWVNQKEQTMKEVMVWNKIKKVDIHDARSVISFRQQPVKHYKIPLV